MMRTVAKLAEDFATDPRLPLIVYCAGNAWFRPVGTDRQMSTGLSRHANVVFVDPPLPFRPRNFARFRDGGVRKIDNNLWVVSPKSLPGVTRPGLRVIAAMLTRRAVRSTVRRLERNVSAIVSSSLDPVLHACPAHYRVFFGTDDFRSGAALMGLSSRWVERREERQLDAATTVVAVSETLAERWRAMGHAVTVIPNGCDTAAFVRTDSTPYATDVHLARPIAGVVGQLNDRLDYDLLEAVADRGVSLLVVGPVSDQVDRARLSRLFDRENVQWIDGRPFDQIPPYLRWIDVGLTPYTNTEFNRGSSPLKTLEYLAAGRRAVVTDLPAAHALDTDLIDIESDPTAFADRVVQRLNQGDTDGQRDERRAFAAQHSWERRVDQFLGLLVDPAES
jgi:teichuronic acid biosynthesis glycosyltransferase TuaH